MLVLSRFKDQQIMIGYEIVLTVVDVNRERVRLGIEAPRDIPIWRREIFDVIVRENEEYRAKLEAEERLKRDGGM